MLQFFGIKDYQITHMKILKRTVNIDERLLLIDTKDLSNTKKILLTYITNFLVNNETLFATNSYLGRRLNMHPSTISTAINDFFEREWIGKFEENGERHIYQTQRHLKNIDEFLGSLKDHVVFLEGLNKRKEGIAERIAREEEIRVKTLAQPESQVIPDEDEKPGPKPVEPKSVEVTTEPQQKEKDLTEELVDTSAGTYVENEEFDVELDKIYESYNIQKKKNESDFDALRWLKSYEEDTGHKYDEFTYNELIKEVEKRFSYKSEISADDYLTYFSWGNNKESYVNMVGDLILEAENRKKKGSTY